MIRLISIPLSFVLSAPAIAGVLEGDSADPLTELNALYRQICQWNDDVIIPAETVDLTHDGVDDYILTYDLTCRGQDNAFSGSAGTARQIWVSAEDGTYLRILDVNARDLQIERREDGHFVILQHQGSYCLTADAAPCFVTYEFTENQLIRAEARHQHRSMTARLQLEQDAQEETNND